PQPFAEGPQVAAASWQLTPRPGLPASPAGRAHHPPGEAAVLFFHGRQQGKGGANAEQGRVAGVNAGHERVGQHLRRLSTEPAANKGVDGFTLLTGPVAAKALGEDGQLAFPAQEITAEKGEEAPRDPAQLAGEKKIAVAAGGFA